MTEELLNEYDESMGQAYHAKVVYLNDNHELNSPTNQTKLMEVNSKRVSFGRMTNKISDLTDLAVKRSYDEIISFIEDIK